MSLSAKREKGFALIGALLLLILISALAVTVAYQTNTEAKISGSDLEDNIVMYAAESGLEKMTSDLGQLYTAKLAPSKTDITNLKNFPPNLTDIVFDEYTVSPNLDVNGNLLPVTRQISAGPDQGLVGEILPVTLSVTARRAVSNAQVRLTRTVEVALIPVFQFGVFSDSDLSYFPGPNFDFAGRVHTNGNLFLAAGSSLVFHDKLSAVKDVVRAQLANGFGTATAYSGTVNIPTASSNGCTPTTSTLCRALAITEGSVQGGPGSTATGNWTTISQSFYNGMLINGKTGAKKLSLPFTQQGVAPIELIRQPLANEDPLSAAGQSRLYNQAQIRVLLGDTQNDLPGSNQSGDVQLDNVGGNASGVPVTGANPTYFARGILNTAGSGISQDSDWNFLPPGANTTTKTWPLIGGWLRVEVKKSDGSYQNVTQEWLNLGFARGLVPPDLEHGISNTVHPNAILLLQEQADRNGDGSLTSSNETSNVTGSANQYSWFPINMYDTREGELRDVGPSSSASTDALCHVGGIINLVEIDVNNLRRWLMGKIGTNGGIVENQSQNGYILYFSDRRGMQGDPFAGGTKFGDYGFQDNVNPGDVAGAPNGTVDAGEDLYGDGNLRVQGANNIGRGFNVADGNPAVSIPNCSTTGRKYQVSGARHAIRLVNGTLGNLPAIFDSSGNFLKGGFTVASEQPVYVKGNYNANDSTGWGTPNAAAAVISDAVTLLSNNWSDLLSLKHPRWYNNSTSSGPLARNAGTTWYRLAIAAGKNMTFPQPTWGGAPQDFGTDGGVHNFLRYLETWGGQTSHYKGSLVSFYFSHYGNGTFKCCTTVYSPPTRDYSFDTNFLNPQLLPPGTPRFRDVVNLSFTQDFTSQ